MLSPELIELSADNNFAEFKVTPNTHGPLTEEAIFNLLALPGFDCLFPLEPSIQKAVIQVNQLSGQDDGQFEQFFQIAERRDGLIEIEISEDKMSAEMQLTAAWGGEEVTIQDILKSLKTNNVGMGLSKVKIQTLLKQITQVQPGKTCRSIIATGKPCVNGVNASLERKVPLARERLLQPQKREDGSVDMRNLGAIIMVKPKDLLMVKHPATLGTKGYNIHGEVLVPIPGKDLQLNEGDGAGLDPANPNNLIATVAGQPVETKTSMKVDDVLNIKDVDVGYGNVDFQGSVLITGDVHEGMVVKSSGDITVMGFVDSATLIAEGDVIVSKGIIGRQLKENELSTKVQAKGQICAQFIQYSDLNAQGEILVTKQLLHSYTKTTQKLTVSDANGRRGDLVGGIVKADKGLKAVIIGATAGTKTEVFCAMKQSELKTNLKELDQGIKSMVVAKLEIESRIKKLPPKSEWQNDAMMVEQVQMMLDEKQRVVNELAREEVEYEFIKQEVDSYYQDNRIEAHKHIFANVEIHIGKAFNRTQREHGTCMVFNQDQEIAFDYNNRG
ncbi:putative polymerase with PALM domain, HD hydrolase domain and Zn ribbon [Shewanella psychrophila]|uniref:Putative polymerase with PALM domain, HD hydrolase domain and Zn ribbon n=1 Tax=Shewanella psychrophila TaxID=225848 RepID=A0A1S6HRE3_9GAMM|nr:FapA family protein [Shewanella psychrophila]AQS38054.1 putative polymerase with PALM domain, HD hydrolase domain and Zn ribbon [Shewanella psychrophila]